MPIKIDSGILFSDNNSSGVNKVSSFATNINESYLKKTIDYIREINQINRESTKKLYRGIVESSSSDCGKCCSVDLFIDYLNESKQQIYKLFELFDNIEARFKSTVKSSIKDMKTSSKFPTNIRFKIERCKYNESFIPYQNVYSLYTLDLETEKVKSLEDLSNIISYIADSYTDSMDSWKSYVLACLVHSNDEGNWRDIYTFDNFLDNLYCALGLHDEEDVIVDYEYIMHIYDKADINYEIDKDQIASVKSKIFRSFEYILEDLAELNDAFNDSDLVRIKAILAKEKITDIDNFIIENGYAENKEKINSLICIILKAKAARIEYLCKAYSILFSNWLDMKKCIYVENMKIIKKAIACDGNGGDE